MENLIYQYIPALITLLAFKFKKIIIWDDLCYLDVQFLNRAAKG